MNKKTEHRAEGPKGESKATDHTPTPWDYTMVGQNEKQVLIRADKWMVLHGEACASATKEEAKNDAAFIVRAVNSHEALLKLAKLVSNTIEDAGDNEINGGDLVDFFTHQLAPMAKRAIAQAEGK